MSVDGSIRSELPDRAVAQVVAARARLDAGGETALAQAVERWAADEQAVVTASGRKPRVTAALAAERRAVVATVLESFYYAGDGPLTSRGAAYVLERFGLPKTIGAFRRVETAALELRDSALVAWEAVADGARSVLWHGRFTGRGEALGWLASSYRRDLWADADVQAQVWVEKAGIAQQIAPHAHVLGVDVRPARGFSGAGFVRSAVADAVHDPRPLVLLLAGDSDSSGARAMEAIERRVRRDAGDLGVDVEAVVRWAVTPEQIETFALPTRPNKDTPHWREGDPDEVVDLDAMAPADLRAALTAAVDEWCPPQLREAAEALEREDRERLARSARRQR